MKKKVSEKCKEILPNEHRNFTIPIFTEFRPKLQFLSINYIKKKYIFSTQKKVALGTSYSCPILSAFF